MLNNALPTDSSLSDHSDSYDEENDQLFTVTRSGRSATTYKRADYLYCYTVWDVIVRILYICLFFNNLVSDIHDAIPLSFAITRFLI